MDDEKRDTGSAARRESALERWHGHAEALHRVGLVDEEELLEILLYADAAYGLVNEEPMCQIALGGARNERSV
ncbi:hypothetical protein [Pseudomonas sp. W2-17]|uniref:hypothetical protein n=1 Tax=Pseudomonas sp. W2-17 TaxID=3058039 RepID=UPI0034E0B399